MLTLIPIATWRGLAPDEPTLPPSDDGARVWGVVWTIDPAYAEEVRAELDFREKAGYSCEHCEVFDTAHDGSERLIESKCSIYVGHVENVDFAGPMPHDELARYISTHTGPSGRNTDYVLELATAIKTLSRDSGDLYLEDIAGRLRAIEAS